MNLDFSEEEIMLKTTARDFLSAECSKKLVRELEEDEKGYFPELWRKMAEQGWMGLALPKEYGGTGMGFMGLMVLLEEMGRNIVPGPFFSTIVLGGLTILAGGIEEQKRQLLPQIARGELILAFALTEPSARYDAAGVSTAAVAEGDEYVINGTKLFVADAHIADYIICVARTKEGAGTEEGITLFLVEAKSPGVKCEVIPTIAADKLCEVIFNKVRVPKKNILGELDLGWKVVKRVLEQATAAKCAEMVGGAQAVLDMTNEYAKTRVQYGRPISSFQAIQHFLADMAVSLEIARNITYEAAWYAGEGLSCTSKVAIAKGWISDAYTLITQQAVHIHGGIGATMEHDISLFYRRAKAAELALGDADFQREVVAREWLGD